MVYIISSDWRLVRDIIIPSMRAPDKPGLVGVLRMEPACECKAQALSVCGARTLHGRGFRLYVCVLAILKRRSVYMTAVCVSVKEEAKAQKG